MYAFMCACAFAYVFVDMHAFEHTFTNFFNRENATFSCCETKNETTEKRRPREFMVFAINQFGQFINEIGSNDFRFI